MQSCRNGLQNDDDDDDDDTFNTDNVNSRFPLLSQCRWIIRQSVHRRVLTNIFHLTNFRS